MSPLDVYRRYVSQRCALAPRGYAIETLPGRTRLTPQQPDLEGMVMFAALSADELEAAITDDVACFARLQCGFEWKVYDFDTPADLASRLARHGFVRDDTEAFMVYPTASHRSKPLRPSARIERLTSPGAIAAVVAVQERIWQRPLPWLARSLIESLPTTSLYGAFDHNELVGTGWIEFPPDSDFADLHGGGILAEQRGRGLYSALFDLRAEEAQRRGYAYLAVDAAPMSRPILTRRGFQFICETTPWRKPAAAPTPK
jgi:ribosomal protein S18 acetylase RimI-like enzyme